MMRGNGMAVLPRAPPRPLVSDGLMPEARTRTSTSPAAGAGGSVSPVTRTSRAGPLRSYQAAFMVGSAAAPLRVPGRGELDPVELAESDQRLGDEAADQVGHSSSPLQAVVEW